MVWTAFRRHRWRCSFFAPTGHVIIARDAVPGVGQMNLMRPDGTPHVCVVSDLVITLSSPHLAAYCFRGR